ncbi:MULTISPECIES: oxidoreductase [Stutzerimonas]|uniref:oxidoreductase n=1 Tax=Stutzerimonas TaxID=2901164 RepID=UPI0005970BCF|nr:NADH:flavin oxidoreductase [Stutzerimonas balearica]KIL05662.1 NADH:flavin oxidoreductase [Stutzerimonas stutzeri]MBD3737749.1 NADH:flavin oxidoreductase [Stutzerimonas balearica]MBK3748041.1 NADH:flavin oxidoreductase [Stutzerimonas balearica]MBK3826238.1 NADH:flavin oxidoreductase [Stutzerimonas balearica]MBK3855929.1 NADH:flavin oxidoreductase [Stutzerimonas balearica]
MPRLADPFALKHLTLRNRAVLAPMTRVSAEPDGQANELMRDYYQSFAEGGFAMLISEGTYTDTEYSQGYFNQPGLATAAQRDSWKPVVEAVHEAGALFIAQLMHGGAQTQGNIHHARHVGPSAVQPAGQQLAFYGGEGPYSTPAEMSEEEIQQAIEGFAQAALHARDAGFDGVELHAANGYLLHEFLSVEFNQRNDRWGGDFKARLALPLAVLRRVREVVGERFVVGMRLSQGMVTNGRLKWDGGIEEAKIRFATLADAGLDYLHVTEYDAAQPAFGEGPSLAAIASRCVPIPVIGNGGITTGEQADALLERDDVALVAIGKAALANHDWPRRIEAGAGLASFEQAMLQPMATLTNELAWRNANDRPATLRA